MVLSESLKAAFVGCIHSRDQTGVLHQLLDGDASFSKDLFSVLLNDHSEYAVSLMRTCCFELFPVALRSCSCDFFEDDGSAWLHGEAVRALVFNSLESGTCDGGSLSAKELHLVCIDHLAVPFVVPDERAHGLRASVCLRFQLLCECAFSALLRLKPGPKAAADGDTGAVTAAYMRKFCQTLRAVVALLTELVSLIAQADSDSDGCDGRTDSGGDDEAEGANPSTIIRLLVTAVDVLHRYSMGGPSATSFVELCCLDEEATYARIYSCVVALSGDVRPGYNGLLLSPDLPGFAHQRLQQSVVATGFNTSLVLLLLSNVFLFPLNGGGETGGTVEGSAHPQPEKCRHEVLRAMLVYSLRFQDCCCGEFSAREAQRGVPVHALLLHPFRCRSFLERHYRTAQAVWSQDAAHLPWFAELPARERSAYDSYCRKELGGSGSAVHVAGSPIAWSQVCDDSAMNQVRDRVNRDPHRSPLFDALGVATATGGGGALGELVHGLNWNSVAVAALTVGLLDSSFLALRPPRGQCGRSPALPLALGVYDKEYLHDISLPAFVTLVTRATSAASDCLRSNCMALGLRLGNARSDILFGTPASSVGTSTSSIDRSQLSMTQLLRAYHGVDRRRPCDFVFVPRAVAAVSAQNPRQSVADITSQLPQIGGSGNRSASRQARVLCRLQASSCDALCIVASLCSLMDTLSSSVVSMTLAGGGEQSAAGSAEITPTAASCTTAANSHYGKLSAPQVHMLLKKFLCTVEPGSMLLLLRVLVSSELGWDALASGVGGGRAFAVGLLVDIVKGFCQYQWSRRAPSTLPGMPTAPAGLLPPAPPSKASQGLDGSVLSEDCQFLCAGHDGGWLTPAAVDVLLKWFVQAVCAQKRREVEELVAASPAVLDRLQDSQQADFISALNLASSLAAFLAGAPRALVEDPQRRVQSRLAQIREQLEKIQGVIEAKSATLEHTQQPSILLFSIETMMERCSLIVKIEDGAR